MTGQVFGRLTVIRHVGRNGYNVATWLCRCDCGVEVISNRNALRSGNTRSCGKHYRTGKPSNARTHGMRRTTEYTSWLRMRERCYDLNNNRYHLYGGRGITVCERWRNAFENFYADMGPKPFPYMSIDRIDPNGNYEPSNCRWATPKQQRNNQRKQLIAESLS